MDFASLITLELDFSEEDVAFADRTALNLLLEELQSKIKHRKHPEQVRDEGLQCSSFADEPFR